MSSKKTAPTLESEVLGEMEGEQGQTEARTALSKSYLVHMTRLCRVTLPLMTLPFTPNKQRGAGCACGVTR
jgi:hypothetical protein